MFKGVLSKNQKYIFLNIIRQNRQQKVLRFHNVIRDHAPQHQYQNEDTILLLLNKRRTVKKRQQI